MEKYITQMIDCSTNIWEFLFHNMDNVVCPISIGIGVSVLIYSVRSLILAFKENDLKSQIRAAGTLTAGIVWIGLTMIVRRIFEQFP